MKRILLGGILGFLCLAIPVKAQLQKGIKYVGATMSFSGSNSQPEYDAGPVSNFNQVSINPAFQAGTFVKDNVMAGIGVGSSLYFAWTKSKPSESLTDYKESRQYYELSPFIRHYKSLGPKWAIFLNSSVDLWYLHAKIDADPFNSVDNGFAAGIQLVPGISYWITPRFALESDLNFLSLSAGYRSFQDNNSIFFNSAVTSNLSSFFSVRASWYLQKP